MIAALGHFVLWYFAGGIIGAVAMMLSPRPIAPLALVPFLAGWALAYFLL